jgi:hypothetical protein
MSISGQRQAAASKVMDLGILECLGLPLALSMGPGITALAQNLAQLCRFRAHGNQRQVVRAPEA